MPVLISGGFVLGFKTLKITFDIMAIYLRAVAIFTLPLLVSVDEPSPHHSCEGDEPEARRTTCHQAGQADPSIGAG